MVLQILSMIFCSNGLDNGVLFKMSMFLECRWVLGIWCCFWIVLFMGLKPGAYFKNESWGVSLIEYIFGLNLGAYL